MLASITRYIDDDEETKTRINYLLQYLRKLDKFYKDIWEIRTVI